MILVETLACEELLDDDSIATHPIAGALVQYAAGDVAVSAMTPTRGAASLFSF